MPSGERRMTMREHIEAKKRYKNMRIMTWIAVGVAAALVLLRVWLLPSVRDWETGLFSPNHYVMMLTVLGLAAMAVLGYLAGGPRYEIGGVGGRMTALASLVCGLTMLVTDAIEGYGSMLNLQAVAQLEGQPLLTAVMPVLKNVFGVLGGIALIVLAMRLLSEGVTRRGIAQWSVLMPVAWMWLRLVNYEISYASMVRLSDSFYGLLMIIFELLFLFKLARYASGVGKMRTGVMAFYALATAALSLSAPLVRLVMYLMGDNAAYEAHHLAGPADFALGLVALAMGVALLEAAREAQRKAELSSPQLGMVDAGDLLTVDPDDE